MSIIQTNRTVTPYREAELLLEDNGEHKLFLRKKVDFKGEEKTVAERVYTFPPDYAHWRLDSLFADFVKNGRMPADLGMVILWQAEALKGGGA